MLLPLDLPSFSFQVPNKDRNPKRQKWCYAHAPSAVSAFSNRFTVFLWTGENDSKTLRVGANFFKNEEKKIRLKREKILF